MKMDGFKSLTIEMVIFFQNIHDVVNPVHRWEAHKNAVTSIDAANNSLISCGHDCSIRWWDLTTYKCFEEQSSHRPKLSEGIWDVCRDTTGKLMAACGADSTIKLYSSQ
jgi:striatin 1/3/4